MGEMSKGDGISSIRGGDFELGAAGVSAIASSGIVVEDITPLTLMPLEDSLELVLGTGVATFTRSITATFIDRNDGLVKTSAINAARFEQNGLLIEGPSTNQLTRSDEFDNAAWTKLNNTISANSSTSPDGSLSADKVIPSAINNAKSLFQASSITTGLDYTQSVYVKANGFNFIQIAASTGFDLFTTWVNINVLTGVIGNRGAGSIGKVNIQPLVDGWFRVSLTSTATSTTSGGFLLQVLNADINARLPAFTGDGTSGVDMWRAQTEQLLFMSSGIQTLGSTVTRTADTLTILPANIPAPTLPYSISALVDIIGVGDAGPFGSRDYYNLAGETLRIGRIWQVGSDQARMFHGPSAGVDNIFGTTPTADNPVNYTTTFDGTQSEFFEDALSQGTNTPSGAVTGTKTNIEIGSRVADNYLFGHIKNFPIYDVALTASQVAAI